MEFNFSPFLNPRVIAVLAMLSILKVSFVEYIYLYRPAHTNKLRQWKFVFSDSFIILFFCTNSNLQSGALFSPS